MMLLSSKKFAIFAVAGLIIPLASILAYNIYIDPFQIIHKDLEQPAIILGGRGAERYQHAGVINQYDIESVIIGHSHAANFLPSKLRKELHWEKVYSLTMDGSSLYEQAVVARSVLLEHEIKNVLWGLYIYNFIRPEKLKNLKIPIQEYLFDGNRLNDLRFFLTLDLQKYYKQKQEQKNQILKSDGFSQENQLDRATSWYEKNICSFNRPGFVADQILRGAPPYQNLATGKKLNHLNREELTEQVPLSRKWFVHYNENLENNLLPIFKEHPDTIFNIVVTAYPTLRMQKMKMSNPKGYKIYLQILRQFVLDTEGFTNVRIHGFDREKFTNDLRLYKDSGHYHLAVNNYIIEQIGSGTNVLTSANIDQYLEDLDEKVTSFRLNDLHNPYIGENTFSTSGFLSIEAAELLIQGRRSFSDREITDLSLKKIPLPKCAEDIKRFKET
ncbi:hypothetical protein [Desulfopila inferna]|uniref:hypothetical protein n=1 Tax=Desulfopila inferna TaxID=468528 RepID=UPI001965E744|nr:hypothetical protein [Desulfopila inferna]MBM9602690.1 hypothetical protein [Desulfopila inferna]